MALRDLSWVLDIQKVSELKTQLDRHFDTKSERFLLDSMDLLRICFDL